MRGFLIFFWLSAAPPAFGAEVIVKELQIASDSKQLAQKKALNEISRDLVMSLIGQDKYQKERRKIESHIIKNQNRYILSVQSSQPVFLDNGKFSSVVTVKASKENLKNLLLEHNLLYASEGSFCLLPIVSFSSNFKGEQKSYSWWLKAKEPDPLLKKLAGSFFRLLKKAFVKEGFYVLDPVFQRLAEGAPAGVLPKKSSRVRDFAPLAEFFVCDIALLGYVQTGDLSSKRRWPLWTHLFSFARSEESALGTDQYFTQFSFNALNIKTRRFLFSLKRQFPFSAVSGADSQKEALLRLPDILDSLIYQLSSYQKEGYLDLNQLLISIQGPLTYAQKERLKNILIAKTPGIQSLRERLLTSSRVVYAAESSQSASSIAKQLKKLSLPGYVIQVKGHRKSELEIYAKKR